METSTIVELKVLDKIRTHFITRGTVIIKQKIMIASYTDVEIRSRRTAMTLFENSLPRCVHININQIHLPKSKELISIFRNRNAGRHTFRICHRYQWKSKIIRPNLDTNTNSAIIFFFFSIVIVRNRNCSLSTLHYRNSIQSLLLGQLLKA